MAYRVRPCPAIKTAFQLVVGNLVERSEVFFHRFGGGRREIAWDAIQFAAIARGNHYGFFQDSAFLQFVGRLQSLLRSESNPLAPLDRSAAMLVAHKRR